MKKAIYYGLILVLACVFLFSAWNLGSYYLGAAENDRLNDTLLQEMEQAKQEPSPRCTSPCRSRKSPRIPP